MNDKKNKKLKIIDTFKSKISNLLSKKLPIANTDNNEI